MHITVLGPNKDGYKTLWCHDVPGVFVIRGHRDTIFYLQSEPNEHHRLHKNFISPYEVFVGEHLNMFWGWNASCQEDFAEFYGYRGKFSSVHPGISTSEYIKEQFRIIERIYQQNTRS